MAFFNSSFNLTFVEKVICKKIILRQAKTTIDTLNKIRVELSNNVQFTDDQLFVLVLFLIYFDKFF